MFKRVSPVIALTVGLLASAASPAAAQFGPCPGECIEARCEPAPGLYPLGCTTFWGFCVELDCGPGPFPVTALASNGGDGSVDEDGSCSAMELLTTFAEGFEDKESFLRAIEDPDLDSDLARIRDGMRVVSPDGVVFQGKDWKKRSDNSFVLAAAASSDFSGEADD